MKRHFLLMASLIGLIACQFVPADIRSPNAPTVPSSASPIASQDKGKNEAFAFAMNQLQQAKTKTDEVNAAFWMEQAAKQGHGAAMGVLGDLYLQGKGVEKDLELAQMYTRMGAASGDTASAVRLGDFYRDGIALPVDFQKAITWYTYAANADDVTGMMRLGALYRGSPAFPPNYLKALEWYIKAAEKNNVEARYYVGWLYARGVVGNHSAQLAVAYLEEAATQGYTDAYAELGDLYLSGKLGKNRTKAALAYYQAGADNNSAKAQYTLGMLYSMGTVVKKDMSKAIFYLEQAAKKDWVFAQYRLATLYANGEDVSYDASKAIQYYQAAATLGFAAAQSDLADAYFEGWGSLKRHLPTALKWYEKAAKQNHPYALYMLSVLYRYGYGVDVNEIQAMKYYEKAHQQKNSAYAQYQVGRRFIWGEGFPRDGAKGAEWIMSAAKAGVPAAESLLGDLYYRGFGVKRDLNEAFAWYQKAADQGSSYGMYSVAVMLQNGEGRAVNDAEAARLLSIASRRGMQAAQHAFGHQYAEGRGVRQSNARAYAWWHVGLSEAFEETSEEMNTILSQMTNLELQNGVALAEYFSRYHSDRTNHDL